nr:hypothetical protein [uncultured Sphingobacterium sp.]
MERTKYQNLLFEILHELAPVPPALWSSILAVVEIRSYKKNRQLQAKLLDLHIVLEGIIVKRRDDAGPLQNDVIDFISKKQFILHIEDVDGSYLKADTDVVTAFISRENIIKLMEKHPIFANHSNYLIATVLNRRSFRGKLLNRPAKDRKTTFAKEYPEANFQCSINDKSSFLGIHPSYYSTL